MMILINYDLYKGKFGVSTHSNIVLIKYNIMKRIFIFSCLFFLLAGYATAQAIKVDYMTKVPKSIQECGAIYTYDTTSLKKKKYIMLADFQNLGMISVNGKMISLQLKDTKLSDKKLNVSTYTGEGYTVITKVKTTRQTTLIDYEDGTLEISKGKEKISIKIHGQSGCDESKLETPSAP